MDNWQGIVVFYQMTLKKSTRNTSHVVLSWSQRVKLYHLMLRGIKLFRDDWYPVQLKYVPYQIILGANKVTYSHYKWKLICAVAVLNVGVLQVYPILWTFWIVGYINKRTIERVKYFYAPAWKVRRGHLVIGSSVCPSVCPYFRPTYKESAIFKVWVMIQ